MISVSTGIRCCPQVVLRERAREMSGCPSDRGPRSVHALNASHLPRRRRRRALALAVMAATAPLAGRAAAGDNVTYIGPAVNGSWDSTGQGYSAWFDTTTATPLNVAP